MENVSITTEGNQIVIRIDKTKTGAPSKSGKTILIASTHGAVNHEGITIGLNAYRAR